MQDRHYNHHAAFTFCLAIDQGEMLLGIDREEILQQLSSTTTPPTLEEDSPLGEMVQQLLSSEDDEDDDGNYSDKNKKQCAKDHHCNYDAVAQLCLDIDAGQTLQLSSAALPLGKK